MASNDLSMILNVGSIVLGLFAWLMSIWAIGKYKTWKATFSYFFCAMALVLQLFEVKNRAGNGDFAAIEDTITAIVFAAVMMLAVTVVLNVVAWFKFRKSQRIAKKEAVK